MFFLCWPKLNVGIAVSNDLVVVAVVVLIDDDDDDDDTAAENHQLSRVSHNEHTLTLVSTETEWR